MTIDIHQHLWPPALIEAFRQRTAPPRLRDWALELRDEPEYATDPRDHDLDERSALAAADGLELALVSLSSALGVETLPAAEAHELLDAYHEGALALPSPFGAWAAACLSEVDASSLERRLEEGFVGLQLPATALLDADGYARVAPLLDVLEARRRPVFIHPGPPGRRPRGAPAWWAPLVSYVQQMHAAWFAFRAHGRPAHPALRVCFAMLAGLAPLHGERLLSRGGERTVVDPDVFLDVSSYGTRALDATGRVLGVDGLVNGSDRPYAAPVEFELGDCARVALLSTNPLRLLNQDPLRLLNQNPLRLLNQEEVIDVMAVAAGAQS